MMDPLLALAKSTSVSPIPTIIPDLPQVTYEKLGDAGARTLWVVFVLMFLSSLVLAFMAWRVPVQKRLFHVITSLITIVATLSYFALATGEGISYTEIIVKHSHQKNIPDTVDHVFRQVLWARYVDWSLTTPLLLLDLTFLAGISGANIFVALAADLIMVLTGLFASYGKSEGVKWGWYAMACAAYLVVVYVIIVAGRRAVVAKDNQTARLFRSIGGYTLFVWTLYPIVWAISDGARNWSVDTEIIAYAILDILAKPVFGFWLLFAHAKKASAIEGFWSNGLSSEGAVHLDDDEA